MVMGLEYYHISSWPFCELFHDSIKFTFGIKSRVESLLFWYNTSNWSSLFLKGKKKNLVMGFQGVSYFKKLVKKRKDG